MRGGSFGISRFWDWGSTINRAWGWDDGSGFGHQESGLIVTRVLGL